MWEIISNSQLFWLRSYSSSKNTTICRKRLDFQSKLFLYFNIYTKAALFFFDSRRAAPCCTLLSKKKHEKFGNLVLFCAPWRDHWWPFGALWCEGRMKSTNRSMTFKILWKTFDKGAQWLFESLHLKLLQKMENLQKSCNYKGISDYFTKSVYWTKFKQSQCIYIRNWK